MNALTSPSFPHGAEVTRTPQDVLAARKPTVQSFGNPMADMAANMMGYAVEPARIGRCYLLEVESSTGKGTYFSETYGMLPKGRDQDMADGLSDLQNDETAVAVWELNPGAGTMRNVSKEFALMWVEKLLHDAEWSIGGFDPADAATWPQFIGRYLTNDEAQRLASE